MKRVVIIQARMTSTRLPGKVLMDLDGKPVLEHLIFRVRQCRMVDDIVLATTVNATDDPIVEYSRRLGIQCFRGSEHDVLSRYILALRGTAAELVVRITSDCPMIAPEVIDRIISEAEAYSTEADYVSNVLDRTYPRGLDVEAVFADALERTHRLARTPLSREHVTYFMYRERPDIFLRRSVCDQEDNSRFRWTVDYQEDLDYLRKLFRVLGLGSELLGYKDIVEFVKAHEEYQRLDTA